VTPPMPIPRGDRDMLGFETLTLCPIDRRLIDRSRLSPAEIAWVDSYHAKLSPILERLLGPEDARWLSAATAPLAE